MMMIQYLLDVGEEVHIPDIKSLETTYADGRAGEDGARAGEAGQRGDFSLFELAREKISSLTRFSCSSAFFTGLTPLE